MQKSICKTRKGNPTRFEMCIRDRLRASLELDRLTAAVAQHEENTRSLTAEIEAQQAAVTQNETACAEAEAARAKAEEELTTYNDELAELGESTGSLTAERERITGCLLYTSP